jgi:hypothetical protein
MPTPTISATSAEHGSHRGQACLEVCVQEARGEGLLNVAINVRASVAALGGITSTIIVVPLAESESSADGSSIGLPERMVCTPTYRHDVASLKLRIVCVAPQFAPRAER